MKKRLGLMLVVIVMMSFVLTGCIPGDGASTMDNPAGFFSGIWHGWIAPFTLIYGIFNKDISIYEIYNTGWWYNFGFYMAIISGFGGLRLARRQKDKDK